MDRKTYSKQYNESKQQLRDAIKRFQQENPKRFAELQAQAQAELNEPPKPRPITRYPTQLRPSFNVDIDTLIMQFRAGRKHYFISTIDCWNESHLYSELLNTEAEAKEVLTQRHSKFTERNERITKIDYCACPLCQ